MIGNTPRYWKRVGWVEIELDDGSMRSYGGTKDSLDFRFSGEKTGSIYSSFTVGILGLSRNTINALTVWDTAKAIKRKRRIRVFAGYSDDSIANPIFDGFVMDAIPTNPPEMWLNFNCMKFFGKHDPVVGIAPMRDKPLKNIARSIASILDLGWNGKSWRSKEVDGNAKKSFHFMHSKAQLMQEFERKFGVRMCDCNGIMVVDDKRPWITHAGDGPSTVLSTDTGLLNLGNITMKGWIAKRRLDETAGLLEWVRFESKFIPKVNDDTYFVIKKKHTGHFRGEEWFTELDCIRRYAKV